MAKSAGSLHCPNCGSPAAPGDATCKYCQARLATVSCPSCFALMFEGAIYCPSCGTKRARTEGGPLTAPCPACKGTMRQLDLGGTDLLECEKCGGTWVDAETFEHICANRETQAAVLHRWPAAAPRAVDTHIRYRRCVRCGTMMNRLNFGRLSGAVLDVCKGHGTFLDAGELHQIVSFIQGGGLERARQRQLEDLKDEEQKLRSLQQAATHDPTIGYVSAVDPMDGLDLISFLQHLLHR
jgi:Zn-finger nucleic acid-binding protein